MLDGNFTSELEYQWWFIPIDILMILLTLSATILSIIFLLIIIFDRTCHTIPMLLVFNSCLSSFINGCDLFSISTFMLHNDIKQIQYEDPLCDVRAYIVYGAYGLLNFSYFIQSLYRYVTVVYPRNLRFRTYRFQIFLISLTWLFALLFPIGFLLTDGFHYDFNNQVCLLKFYFSFSIIYGALCTYTIPVCMTVFIYIKLVRYVHQMSKRTTPVNVLNRVKRELKMVQRTIVLISILVLLGFPYVVFIIISFIQRPPKYHLRIILLCINISMFIVMIVMYVFTEPLKVSLMKIRNYRRNLVVVATLR